MNRNAERAPVALGASAMPPHIRPSSFLSAALPAAGLLFASPASADPPPAPAGTHWVADDVLSDEFDGTALDTTKWRNGHPFWAGRAPSRFAAKNVSISDGTLDLRTTSRIRRPSQVHEMAKNVWIDAACISSIAPSASYGYYEARLKASRLATSSSFWFQGRYSEIDVVEGIGNSVTVRDSAHKRWSSTHYFPEGFAHGVRTTTAEIATAAPVTDWHVYGVWWKDSRTVWFYLDGIKVGEQSTGGDFREPMYLFFDTEAFLWHGLPSITALGDRRLDTMQVDWVRAYDLAPDRGG